MIYRRTDGVVDPPTPSVYVCAIHEISRSLAHLLDTEARHEGVKRSNSIAKQID